MTAQVTRIGDLSRRLVLEAPSESDDGVGSVIRLYDVVTTLWAQVTPLPARAEVAADSLGATARYRIVVRTRDDITLRHRFIDGLHTYRIRAMTESADRRFLEIDAEVRED